MKFHVYPWFPYQSSDRCNEVNDITLLDIWVIFVRVYFTKKSNSFPANFNKNFNGCPKNSVVIDGQWDFTTKYFNYKDSNGSVGR